MRTIVLWDLDGTLLTTNRGGVAALEDAAAEVCGRRPDLSGMKTAGMTDREISASIVAGLLGRRDEAVEATLLDRYAAALPGRLEQRRGHVMPHVPDVLAACTEAGIVLGLLTGNVESCAHAKLSSYGLDGQVFSVGGFAHDGHRRTEIGRAALARCGGREAWEHAFLVGDTPSDVATGLELDLQTIAVATGGFSAEDLRAAGAWAVVEQLPPPAEFLAMVGAR